MLGVVKRTPDHSETFLPYGERVPLQCGQILTAVANREAYLRSATSSDLIVDVNRLFSIDGLSLLNWISS